MVDLKLPLINAARRKAWKPILSEMGPRWNIVILRTRQVIKGMERLKVAEFLPGPHFVIGRLTPIGVALRDRWHSWEAAQLDKQRKRYKQGRRSWKDSEPA